jgi:hypothetical protein
MRRSLPTPKTAVGREDASGSSHYSDICDEALQLSLVGAEKSRCQPLKSCRNAARSGQVTCHQPIMRSFAGFTICEGACLFDVASVSSPSNLDLHKPPHQQLH